MTVKELINEELINEGNAKEITKVKINIKNKPYELYIYTIANLKKFLTAETIKKIKEQLKCSIKYRCFSNEEINIDNQNEIKLFNIKTENFEDVNINEVFNNDETFKKIFVLSKNIKHDEDNGIYSLFCNSVVDNKKIGDYIVCTPGYVKKKFKIKNLSINHNNSKGIAIIKDGKLFSKYNKFEENPTITNIDEFKNYLFRIEKNKKETTIANVTKKLLNEIMEETKRGIYKEQIKEIEEIAKKTFNTKGSIDVKGDNDFKLSFVLAGINKSMVFVGSKDEIIEQLKNTDEYKNKQLAKKTSKQKQEDEQLKDTVNFFNENNNVENALKVIYQELKKGYIRAYDNSIAVFEKRLAKEQSEEVKRIGISNGADALVLMPENNKCLFVEYKSSEMNKPDLRSKAFEGAIKLLKSLKNNSQNNVNFGVSVLKGDGYDKLLEKNKLIKRDIDTTQVNEYTFNNIKYNYLLNGLNGVLFAVSSQEEFKSFLKEVLKKCYALVNKFDTESLKNALSNNLTAKDELIKMAQKEKEINEEVYQYRINNKEILKDYVVLYSSLVSLSTLSQFINVNEPLTLLKRLEDIAVKAVSKRTNNSYNRLKTKTVYYNNQYQNAASVETIYFNY
jgi:hypothetical protein